MLYMYMYVIFFIREKFVESIIVFSSAFHSFSAEIVSRKVPILVFANKQDIKGALSVIQVGLILYYSMLLLILHARNDYMID